MESLSNALNGALRSMSTDEEVIAKTMRAQKVKDMWRDVVDSVFLDHTNSVYILNEDGVKTLIVYVDDSLFAAELNARRELIKLKLFQKFNEEISDFQIKISWGKYKRHYLYRDDKDNSTGMPQKRIIHHPLSKDQIEDLRAQVASVSNERIRQSLLNAMIHDLEYKTEN